MREILFRGKTENGDWLYGYLFIQAKGSKYEEVTILGHIDHRESLYDIPWHSSIVLPETVGQYTGFTDKNGKKIFEGDIVKVTNDNGETDLCSCGIGYVCFYDGTWYVCDEVNDGLYDVNKIYYIEVIGNIHDNPELLEER